MGDTPHCTTLSVAPANMGLRESSCSRGVERVTVGGGAWAIISLGRVTSLMVEEVVAPAQGGMAPVRGSVRGALLLVLPGRRRADMASAGPQNVAVGGCGGREEKDTGRAAVAPPPGSATVERRCSALSVASAVLEPLVRVGAPAARRLLSVDISAAPVAAGSVAALELALLALSATCPSTALRALKAAGTSTLVAELCFSSAAVESVSF